MVNYLEQRFGQKHLALMRRRELKNRIQESGEELQDCSKHPTPRPGGIPKCRPKLCGECCSKQLRRWNPRLRGPIASPHALLQGTSLQHWLMHWNLKQQDHLAVMVHQLKEENAEPKSSSSKGEKNSNINLLCHQEASNVQEETCPRSRDFTAGMWQFQLLLTGWSDCE